MHRAPAVAALALAALVAGCDDARDSRPSPTAPARMELDGSRLAVDAAGSDFTRLRLSVEGGGLRERMELVLESRDGEPLVGAIALPAGDGYAIVARGYDAEGRLTQLGKGELTVRDAITPQVEIMMEPEPGADWGAVRIGSHRLAASTSRLVLEPGADVRLELGLVDADGRLLELREGALDVGFPGWPHEPPRIDVVYGGREAIVAWQQMRNGPYGGVRVCTDGGVCLRIPAPDPTKPAHIVTGTHMACVLRANGNAGCFGDGSAALARTNGVSNLIGYDFVELTVGQPNGTTHNAHACGLDRQGGVWCWGDNSDGKVGTGALGGSYDVPQKVALAGAATQVTAGARHTCALLVGGSTYCWGETRFGQLGNGVYRYMGAGPAPQPTPTQVSWQAPPFTRIGAGNGHTCGLTATGAVYCWGRNYEMQGGTDTTQSVDCNYIGLDELLGPHFEHCLPYPKLVQGAPAFDRLAVNSFDTCGIEPNGNAWCWGAFWQGNPQPGESATWSVNKFAPQPVQGGVQWSSVSIGYGFKCGLNVHDQGVCWGVNNSGQHGTGAASYPPAAIPNGSAPILYGQPWVSLDVGFDHACAIGWGATGAVFCWGSAGFGNALGYPVTNGSWHSAAPQAVTVTF